MVQYLAPLQYCSRSTLDASRYGYIPKTHRIAGDQTIDVVTSCQACDVQKDVAQLPASAEESGPYHNAGATARLRRRLDATLCPAKLNLAHSLWGQSQMSAVQVCFTSTSPLLFLNLSSTFPQPLLYFPLTSPLLSLNLSFTSP
jgi:hypothetical protein